MFSLNGYPFLTAPPEDAADLGKSSPDCGPAHAFNPEESDHGHQPWHCRESFQKPLSGAKQTSGSSLKQGQGFPHGLKMQIPEKILMESTEQPLLHVSASSTAEPLVLFFIRNFGMGSCYKSNIPRILPVMFNLKEQEFCISWQNVSKILVSLEKHRN